MGEDPDISVPGWQSRFARAGTKGDGWDESPFQYYPQNIVKTPLTTPVNATPTRWQDYRAIIYTPDTLASGYNVYVFDNLTAANAGNISDAVAVARDVKNTPRSGSSGGSALLLPPVVTAAQELIDVRLIQYENLNGSNATRILPAGYTPGGIGESYFAGPAPSAGDTTNLKPGQYWFRIQAVAADTSVNTDSNLSARIGPFTVAMGPDEARDLIEANLANVGTSFRIVDLRGGDETVTEGHLRYTTNAFLNNATQTAVDNALLSHIPASEKDTPAKLEAARKTVTVLVY